jgi:hypothetical protein
MVPFLQLGRLVPYSDRKNMLSDKVPALSVILQKKRRHSSDRSDNLRDDSSACKLMPLNKAPKIDSTDSVEVLSRGPNEEQDYEPETGRDGKETEIDSAPSSFLQIP